jgi:integrase
VSSDRLYVAWRLSLYGLRRGEVLGLRWSDIDLRARTLTVNQARILVEYRVRIEEPKSRNGKRTLPLDAELIAALTALRKRQPRESTIAATAYGSGVAELDWHRGGEYVITDAAGTGVWFYLGALGATLAVGTLKAVIARHISAHQRAAL